MEEFVIIVEDGSERKLCYRNRIPFLGKLSDAVDLADDLKTANPQFDYKLFRVVEYATAGRKLSPKVQFEKLVNKLPKSPSKPLSGIKERKAKIRDPYSTVQRASELTKKRGTIQKVLRSKK